MSAAAIAPAVAFAAVCFCSRSYAHASAPPAAAANDDDDNNDDKEGEELEELKEALSTYVYSRPRRY